jgi:plasmid maintenance system antidote protein VapI
MLEGQEAVVETSEVQESQSTTSEPSQSSEPAAQVAAPQPKDETPFHQHPRWIERDNELKSERAARQALELKIANLEGRLSQPQTQAQKDERDELIEDLKKIDPRLASRLEAFGNSSKTIQELQSKLEKFEQAQQQQSQQQIVQQSVAKINSWHEANKVPEAIKNAINAQLDVQYMQGKLNPQNLEAAYKAAYEPYKAFLEETKREALKSYVPAKQADAKVPASQPKGQPASKPKAPTPPQFKDREELRAHVAKEFVQQQKAKREASSI